MLSIQKINKTTVKIVLDDEIIMIKCKGDQVLIRNLVKPKLTLKNKILKFIKGVKF